MIIKKLFAIFPDINFWLCSSVNLPPRKIFSSSVGEPAVETISRTKKKEVTCSRLYVQFLPLFLSMWVVTKLAVSMKCLP